MLINVSTLVDKKYRGILLIEAIPETEWAFRIEKTGSLSEGSTFG